MNHFSNTPGVHAASADSSYWIGPVINGIRLISKDGYLGLADAKGKILCIPRYDRIFRFQGEVAIVCRDDRYGLIDRKGNEIVAPSFSFISEFTPELAWAYDEKSHTELLLRKNGERLYPPKHMVMRRAGGQYLFTGTDRHILLSPKGKAVLEIDRTLFGGAAGDNLFVAYKDPWASLGAIKLEDERQVLADRNDGLPVSTPLLPANLPFYFSEGLASVPENVNGIIKMGYIDTRGRKVIPCIYDDAQHFINGLACVKKGGKWGAIDVQNRVVIPFEYAQLENANGVYFLVNENGKTGVITKEGQLIAPLYSRAHYLFADVFAFLPDDGSRAGDTQGITENTFHVHRDKWGAVNVRSGNELLPFEFHEIRRVTSSFGVGTRYVLDEGAVAPDSGYSPEMSKKPPLKYNGYAISSVFTDGQRKGTYTSPLRPLYNHFTTSGMHIEKIIPYKQVNDYYDFSGSLIDREGDEVSDNTLLGELKTIGNMGLVIFTDSATLKKGVHTTAGEQVIAAVYISITIGKSGIIVENEQGYGYADLTVKTLLPTAYEALEETPAGVLRVLLKGEQFLMDKQGKKII